MNPHELAVLSSQELSYNFRQALSRHDVALVLDIFTQVESRFQKYITSKEGSQKFVDEFLALCGSAEVKGLHVENQLQQCITRLEYLLELAGELARAQTSEETLLQIVESRERGPELIEVLGHAPMQGMIASELAEKLGISQPNLSPLIRLFSVEGIIDKRQIGKNVFLRLTGQGRGVLQRIKPAEQNIFALVPSTSRQQGENLLPSGLPRLFSKLMIKVAHDVRDAQFVTDKAIAGIFRHSLDNMAEEYYQRDRQISWWITCMADEFRKTISDFDVEHRRAV
jgi:DNA-binding MarR family transcriptional regulator